MEWIEAQNGTDMTHGTFVRQRQRKLLTQKPFSCTTSKQTER